MTDNMNGNPNENEIKNEDTLEAHPGYAYEADIGYQNPKWMSVLKDDVKTSELSIPGTHGSMALYNATPFEDIAKNQTMSLTTQLNSGIRYVDMRVRRTKDAFAMHHGQVYQNAMFGDVLRDTINFLRQNPTETVFMRVKEEHDPEAGSLSFEAIFQKYWDNNTVYFWDPNSVPTAERDNPKLRNIRGKIVVIKNFSSSKEFGINYGSLNNQDQYNVANNLDGMYNKWTAVKNHLYAASNSNKSQIYLNHFSGTSGSYGGAYPWFVASGKLYRDTGSNSKLSDSYATGKYPDYPKTVTGKVLYSGTNILGTNLIQNGSVSHTGIIAADFPGKGLIEGVIKLNAKHANSKEIHHIGLNAVKRLEIGFTGNYYPNTYVITRNESYIAHYSNGKAYYASLAQTDYGHRLTYNQTVFNSDKIGVLLEDRNGNRTLIQEFPVVIAEGDLGEVKVPDGKYNIVSALNSLKVVDMTLAKNVVLHSKHGDKNQQWRFVYDSSKQAYQIKSEWDPNYVLAWNSSGSSINVFAERANSSKLEQYWKLKKTGEGDGYVYFENKKNGHVLDIERGSTQDSTNINVWPRSNTTKQKFKLTPA
ncbi:phosphatidylinositol-specific phospholipase C domain-containing protein [Bacillus mycoides]|uniref:phosphatidylinositol-specific phospholipase C domain-containing protein n=1 Tax=Bacillus mycoides TaxID=1405 RepID=UPI002E1A3B2E|nr:phosphatidylinositol-specific phospholipase C domain-containing protein [Bacillus mycoides]